MQTADDQAQQRIALYHKPAPGAAKAFLGAPSSQSAQRQPCQVAHLFCDIYKILIVSKINKSYCWV
jgi:hypothetical protein